MTATTDNWSDVEAAAKSVLPQNVIDFIAECRKEERPESFLIAILHKVQDEFGFLSQDKLDAVAQLLQVPTARVTGVASFYHFFRLTPRGKYVISLCMGTACYVNGADRVGDKLVDELGINFGETTKDGMFTLEATRCLGTCGLAPVAMVEEEVHGKLTPDQIPALLEKYINEARHAMA